MGALPTVVGQLSVPQNLFAHLDQRVDPALPGRALVAEGVAAGERLESGEHRLAVLGGDDEPAAQRAVGVTPVLQ